MKRVLLFLLVLVAFSAPKRALADDVERGQNARATFALIIGSNVSVDKELTPLKYADDDAARYLDLFRLLGARTYLLSRLDENTRRLHPQAAAEAMEPRRARLDAAIAQLVADVQQAAARNVETQVYVLYAGHGNVNESGEGYITLEDARLTGNDLAALFAKIPATRIHLIADACASYFLAYSRGPGGERRAIGPLEKSSALAADKRVGLLLSTSSARESHEWDAFQAGVFSHEVRSGLYGAADADGDGQVSYREIAAFVARANGAVPNEKYRPDVHARAPKNGDTLLDIKRARGRRVDIDGEHAGHYYLEDERGVRIADVHNGAGQTLSLLRPTPAGRLFLRRVEDDREIPIPAAPAIVGVNALRVEDPRIASRGAAHESFGKLFALPFDRNCVDEYGEAEEEPAPKPIAPPLIAIDRGARTRRIAGISALAVGGVALATTAVFVVLAEHEGAGASTMPQAEIAVSNARIDTYNSVATVAVAVSGVAVVTGITLLVWPGAKVRAAALPNGGFVGYGGSF